MSRQHGFTLTELLVTLAILGVLATVAMPSYQQSVRKANRSDARTSMAMLSLQQEKYFLQYNNYTGDFADLVSGAVSGDPLLSDEGHYNITLNVSPGGTSWSMIATPLGNQAKDEACVSMTLTSQGAKTALDINGTPNPDCW